MMLNAFYSKKVENRSSKQFLLAFTTLYIFAELGKNWRFNGPYLPCQWLFDNLRIADDSCIEYFVNIVNSMRSGKKYLTII